VQKKKKNAQFKLGCIYWEGSDAVKKDILMATKWFNMAADKGHKGAQRIIIDNSLEVATGRKDEECSTKDMPESSSAMHEVGACAKPARKMNADTATSE
jgi:TPR repeat protein